MKMRFKIDRIISLKLDHVISATAVIISLSAFMLSLVQSRSTIKHYHVSLEPRLRIFFSNEEQQGKFGLYLSNIGLGPAYFTEFTRL
jgi:hypothetical protein